ncbi:MAG: TRAP transporter small permease [Oscillospiraceae bacterium]|nr:TRAP transporter small permease [Oscillospiraceae bacterium]
MRTAISTLNKCAIYISALVLFCLLLLVIADVLLRNIFFTFIPGVFELTQIFSSVIVFMAIAFTQYNKEHVAAQLFSKTLKHHGKIIFSLISSLLFLVISGVTFWFIFQFAIAQFSRADSTLILNIHLGIISIIGALGMFLFCLSVIGDLMFIIKDKEVLQFDPS